MMATKKIISVILAGFSFIIAIAQQNQVDIPDKYHAVYWSNHDGLSTNIVNVMIKDVYGFVWFGSTSGALCRFDGAKFKKYLPDRNKQDAIYTDTVNAFVEDSLHNIWIGTNSGLIRYDIKADTFANFVPRGGHSESSVVPFWATKTMLYCIEAKSRIVTYSTTTFEKKELLILTDSERSGFNGISINSTILNETTNSILLLTNNPHKGGIRSILEISIKNRRADYYPIPCFDTLKVHDHGAEAMRYDRNRNSIWINSNDGLLEFSLWEKKFQGIDAMKPFIQLKDYNRWVGIDLDRYGRVWLATQPKGILIYDPKTGKVGQPFSNPGLLDEVSSKNFQIYCDREGVVWTSYWLHKGIYQLFPYDPPVKRYVARPQLKDSISSSDIFTIFPSTNGKLWIGTKDGLNIFDPETEKFEALREKDLPGVKGTLILGVGIDTVNQKAWIKADEHFYEMDLRSRKCIKIIFRDGSKLFHTISNEGENIVPYKNGVLVGCHGVGLFEIKQGNSYADLIIPLSSPFYKFAVEDDRIVYIKSRPGFQNFKFENIDGKWRRTPHLLDTLHWTHMLYSERDKTSWVGFKDKLVHFDKDFKIIKSYGQHEGFNDQVVNMVLDNSGNLWFINNLHEIGRLNPATGYITTLSESHGYTKQHYTFHDPAAKDAWGNIYFASTGETMGSKGLDRIDPAKIRPANISYVYMRSLSINQTQFAAPVGLNALKKLMLDHFQNTISIETGILDFYSKGKGQIRYKLEKNGKDENWQYGPAYYAIRYEGLPPGSYRLIMQASNSANEFTGPERILQIDISPAFWNTWWFRIPTIIFFIAAVYGIIRLRLQQKFRLQLERSEKETELAEMRMKTAELQQQATELEMQALRAQMNPHFIFNSLNSINRFILQNNKAQASEYLTKFSKLVRLILQNSQASLIPLEIELEALELYLDLEAVRFDHRFGYKISVPKDLDVEVLRVPPLIIQPYAENAIWHGLMHKEGKGQLDVEVTQENDHLLFRIADDGIGRKAAAEFAGKSATKHKSMGLKITADRIAMLQNSNGKESLVRFVDLTHADGSAAGTEVIIKMPVIYE